MLLTLALLLQLLPASIFATQTGSAAPSGDVALSGESQEALAQPTHADPAEITCEVESLRGETSKQFRMSDGSFTAIQYDTAVHYADEDGHWLDIDNTLQPMTTFSGDSFYAASNGEDTKAFASDLANGSLFTAADGDRTLELSLFDPNLLTAQEDALSQPYTFSENASQDPEEYAFHCEVQAQISSNDVAVSLSEDAQAASFIPDTLSSTVLYEDVFDNVDLKYELFGYNIKESIIVKALRDTYTFDFVLRLNGLSPVMQEDGSIRLLDEESVPVYEIPAPYMIDASLQYSDAVSYELSEWEDDAYVLRVDADASWISDASLPVTIDPTIFKIIDSSSDTTSKLRSTYIFSGAPNTKYSASQSLYAGYTALNNGGEYQIITHVADLPSLPANCSVLAAELKLYHSTFSNDSSANYLLLEAHEMTLDKSASQTYPAWIDSLTWNTVHPNGTANYNSQIVDFTKLTSATRGGYIALDLTKSVRNWYQNGTQNRTLLLKTDASSTKRIAATLLAYSSATYFAVVYRNDVGIEDRYTYQKQNAVRAGMGYLSDHTQRLTFLKSLIASDSDLLPFGLSLVYNSSQNTRYFDQTSDIHSRDYSNMKFGAGWKLSAQECVQSVRLDGDDANTLYWVYTDSDGTEHYFFEQNGEYRDEDGLGLKIELVSETGHTNFKMTDDLGNERYFRDGLLTYSKDAYGNGIYYVYNDANFSASIAADTSNTTWMPTNAVHNQLTDVYRVIKGSTAEHLADLTYDSAGFLTTVCDEAQRETQFYYTTVGGIRYLDHIVHPDSTQVKYAYGTHGMVNAYDVEANYGIWYEYGSGGMVVKYNDYYLNGTTRKPGQIISCWNGNGNRSSYRNWGDDQTSGTSDDLRAELIFDNTGRTVSQYTTDNTGAEVLGSTELSYTSNNGTSKKNNRITAVGSSGITAVNLLKDGSMETDGAWTNASSTNASTALRDAANGCEPRHGNRGLKLWIASSAGTDVYAANYHSAVYLEANVKYTFSAYFKVSPTDNTWNSGATLKMRILNSSGGEAFVQSVLDAAPNKDIENGWQRVSASFSVDTAGNYRPGFVLQGCPGLAFIDDVQLERADSASVYNLVQNGSFEDGSTHWTWGSLMSAGAYETPRFGTKSLRATGAVNGIVRASQTIPLNCTSDTTFKLSGWAKGHSAPNPAKEFSDSARFFGLAVRLDYSDGTTEFHSVPFDWSTEDWQCAAGNIVPKKENLTITQAVVFCAYDNNAGSAAFDNISLRQEPIPTYAYDDDGNLISATQSGNEKSSREYDGVDLVKYTDLNGVTYNYSYNSKHQPVTAISGNLQTTYAYDTATGRATSTTVKKDGTTSSVFLQSTSAATNDPNHADQTTDVNGSTTTYTYNAPKELLIAVKNANNVTTNYTYNNQNDRPNTTFQSGIAAVTYYYNQGALSLLSRKTFASAGSSTPIWQCYSFGMNEWGQRTSVSVGTSSDGNNWTTRDLATYLYEANGGNLSKITYANGNNVSYEYDRFDRPIKTVYNDTGRYIEYAYTAEGVLSSLTYKDANHAVLAVYHFEYDSLGRLIRSRQTNGAGSTIQRTEHLYDTANRLTAQSWMLGNRTFTERYVYDDPTTDNAKGDGSLKQMTTGTGATIDFTYDTLKRLQKETVKSGSTGIYNTAYAYRTVGGNRSSAQVEYRNVRLGSTISGTLIGGEKFSYDALGNITSIYETTSNDGNYRPKALYEYDSQNQLTKETLYTYSSDTATTGTATVYTYTYDTAGNIRAETKTTGGTATTKSYTYGDALWKDLLTKVGSTSITYDDSGNPLNWYNGKKTYSGLRWEHGRQLARLSVGGTAIHYEYDADGIRTKMSAGSTTYEYITQGGKLMRETATKGSTVYVMDFIYDNAGRPFSVKFSKNGGSSFTTYYYVLNLQGDVVKIIKADGTVMATYTYDAWGNLVSLINASGNDIVNSTAGTAIAFWNPLTYRGYIRDRETGFYYLQSRYYDPANHRFINADGFASTGQGFVGTNMFAYCNNCPVVFSDPSGHWSINTIIDQIVDTVETFIEDTFTSMGIMLAAEHHKRGTTNRANRQKHEDGLRRKATDAHGEKGDARRPKDRSNKHRVNQMEAVEQSTTYTQNGSMINQSPSIFERIGNTTLGIGSIVVVGLLFVDNVTGIGAADDIYIEQIFEYMQECFRIAFQ